MAVTAANMLAAAVVPLAASTAGRERCDCDRGSAARDRSCAGAERSTNGRQYVIYDIISNIFNIANCSLRWNTRLWVPRVTNDGRRAAARAARNRSRAGVTRSTNRRQYVNYDIISNISNIAKCSLRWNTRQWILAGTNDAWRRAARDRSRAGAERSTSGRWNAHNNAQTNSIWLAKRCVSVLGSSTPAPTPQRRPPGRFSPPEATQSLGCSSWQTRPAGFLAADAAVA